MKRKALCPLLFILLFAFGIAFAGITVTPPPVIGGDLWGDPVDANVVPDGNNTRDSGSAANNFANFHGRNLESNDDLSLTVSGNDIIFLDGSEGTSGHVWTSTGTLGEGGWSAPAAAGANVNLSNLSSPVAINEDLLFNGGSINIGNTTNGANEAFLDVVRLGRTGGGVMWLYGAGSTLHGQLNSVTLATPSGVSAEIHLQMFNGVGRELAISTANTSGSTVSNPILIETGNNSGTADTALISLRTGVPNSGARGPVNVEAGLLNVSAGIAVVKVTADPCGDAVAFPESTQFYNDTSNYYCYCDGTNDVQMHSPATACF